MANPLVCLREEITGNRSHHNMTIYHCGGKNNAVIGNCGQPEYTSKNTTCTRLAKVTVSLGELTLKIMFVLLQWRKYKHQVCHLSHIQTRNWN